MKSNISLMNQGLQTIVLGSLSTVLFFAANCGMAEAASLKSPTRINAAKISNSPEMWEIPINRGKNKQEGTFTFEVFNVNNKGWKFSLEQNSNNGSITLRLLDDYKVDGKNDRSPDFISVNSSQRFDSERTANEIIFGSLSTSKRSQKLEDRAKFVRNGKFQVQVQGNAKGTLTAQAVPEPFSTTAAVGLAIAGAARTLKRKKTDDA